MTEEIEFTQVMGDDWYGRFESADGRFVLLRRLIACSSNGYHRTIVWTLLDQEAGVVSQTKDMVTARIAAAHLQRTFRPPSPPPDLNLNLRPHQLAYRERVAQEMQGLPPKKVLEKALAIAGFAAQRHTGLEQNVSLAIHAIARERMRRWAERPPIALAG